ncbi:hypothetical protein GCM10027605_40270 [Micromonospora zhanjiangensis]
MTTPRPSQSRVPRHPPLRPSWRCRTCGHLWPCESAKADVIDELNGDMVAVAVFMAASMSEAMHDLMRLTPDDMPTPAEVWDRFLQWLDVARRLEVGG